MRKTIIRQFWMLVALVVVMALAIYLEADPAVLLAGSVVMAVIALLPIPAPKPGEDYEP